MLLVQCFRSSFSSPVANFVSNHYLTYFTPQSHPPALYSTAFQSPQRISPHQTRLCCLLSPISLLASSIRIPFLGPQSLPASIALEASPVGKPALDHLPVEDYNSSNSPVTSPSVPSRGHRRVTSRALARSTLAVYHSGHIFHIPQR